MPNKVYADLHTHSTASDGTFTAAEVVSHAAEIGLKAISLTDHDSVAGVSSAMQAGVEHGVEVIPGIEMGSDVSGHDIHILGYFIETDNADFLRYLENLKSKRIGRAEEMCGRLTSRKMPITIDEALALAPGGVLTRAHIARALVNKGYVTSVNEVFEKYLANGKPCFVPKYNETADDVIDTILKAGGLPVLAHPKLSAMDNRIESLTAAGLRGLEVYCIDHRPGDIRRYLRLADKLGLLVTGGSDCHGPKTPGRFLMGYCGVNKDRLTALKEAAARN
jgi:hypothetical protein